MTRGLLGRAFGYFTPYWARGLLVAVCIAAESALGLAPAVVFRALIDYLARPHAQLGHVVSRGRLRPASIRAETAGRRNAGWMAAA